MNVCSYHLQEAGRDAGAGAGVLPGHRRRRARRRPRLRPGGGRPLPCRRRLDLVLRQRRHPLRRGGLQAPGLHRAVGPHQPRALRRRRPEAAPLPLRRAGELPRPDRGPTREQRAAHRPGDARRHAVQERPGPVDPAPGVERGARPAPPVGPAVVVAHATGAGLRDRPARVRRHLRRLQGGGGPDRRARRCGPGRARRRAGPGRRLRGHRQAQGPARAARWPSAPVASRRASRWWWASTGSPRRRRRRSAGRATSWSSIPRSRPS